MIHSIEFVLKIAFLVLSAIWARKILILRSDKQIVVNPLIITIGAILAVLPDDIGFIDIDMIYIRIALYVVYVLVILFGIYNIDRNDLYYNKKRL
ncbi:MAG: hypothetical protein IJH34_15625 [Romboutsia sp.]|jgi:hypothetical protein|nr:hypothetical protein [Romboutsia sp.]